MGSEEWLGSDPAVVPVGSPSGQPWSCGGLDRCLEASAALCLARVHRQLAARAAGRPAVAHTRAPQLGDGEDMIEALRFWAKGGRGGGGGG